MAAILIAELTSATVLGTGAFDVLMKATVAHITIEYEKNRIRGPEYSTVYLGAMEAAMRTGLDFVLQAQKTGAEIDLIKQQTLNAIIEGTVLVAQRCKLEAEFDLTKQQTLKAIQETNLLTQKIATERAQTLAIGVDADSVLGKQKALYQAQTSGFTRDAEQKAADILVGSWKVRRTTDEATVADATNKLNDLTIGRVVDKLLLGVGA